MRNQKSSYRFVLMLVLVLALAAFPASVSANHSWGGYHWARTANPFTIKLGDNVSGLWDGMLVTASNDWTKSNVMKQPLSLAVPSRATAVLRADVWKSAMLAMVIRVG